MHSILLPTTLLITMNKKLQIRNVFIVIFVSSVLMVSQACEADICSRVEKQKSFSDIDSIENGFFEKYYVRKSGDVYYIYAEKSTQLDYIAATEVMKKLESYPQFMPGYKAISVRREMNKEIVADIQFRPWFSFFRSRFSNQLEIVVGLKNYKQCWEQLDSTDERVNGKYNFEPKKIKDTGT